MVAAERELTSTPPPKAAISADAIPLQLRRIGGCTRDVLTMSLIGAVMLAVFASHDLASWLDRLGGGPILAPLQQAAARWDGAMERLGLTRPHDLLRSAIRNVLDQRW